MRAKDLTERLVEFADSVAGEPFEWGHTDCATLAVRALFYANLPDAERVPAVQHYTSEDEARGALQRITPADWLDELGATPIPIGALAPGDVVTGWLESGLPYVYVVVGSRLLSSTPAEGVRLMPLRAARLLPEPLGWRLP